jgi:hypothetical protein
MNLACVVLALSAALCADAPAPASALDLFTLDGSRNLMDEEHFGIVNGMATVGVNHRRLGSVSGFWSPPYAASNLLIEPRINDKPIPVSGYTWLPFSVSEHGTAEGLDFACTITLVDKTRGGLISITVTNPTDKPVTVPFTIEVSGGLAQTNVWEFGRPESTGDSLDHDGITLLVQFIGNAPQSLDLAPGARRTLHVVFAAGTKLEAITANRDMLSMSEGALDATRSAWERRADDLFKRLPRLESDNAALVTWYNRSLVHLLTNRWDLSGLALSPYYSTGSVKGGCVCDYLWNFGEVWKILPLYDPAAMRAHIAQFLRGDITQHFAFNPVTGEAFGPWYPVNQEKIIGLIYYYVKVTGDTAFLAERVGDKTILDWTISNALHGDDVNKPVALIDYGPSNSHLELRRGLPYNHVMPDLNGRRVMNCLRAAELCDVAAKPMPVLRERAAELAGILKKELWDKDLRWFRFRNEKGEPDTRYTVQMFKLFNSPVLDDEETAGLLSHLNNKEFLSQYGLHSLAKQDPAYDPADVDNGGPGVCTSFLPQIMERLYNSGHTDTANDLLSRVLWWGCRLPYWGDSIVADKEDYRHDTPLQCTIDGSAGAQGIIFGLFGVAPSFDGSISVAPHLPRYTKRMALRGLKLREKTLDIEVEGSRFRVRHDGTVQEGDVGQELVIR